MTEPCREKGDKWGYFIMKCMPYCRFTVNLNSWGEWWLSDAVGGGGGQDMKWLAMGTKVRLGRKEGALLCYYMAGSVTIAKDNARYLFKAKAVVYHVDGSCWGHTDVFNVSNPVYTAPRNSEESGWWAVEQLQTQKRNKGKGAESSPQVHLSRSTSTALASSVLGMATVSESAIRMHPLDVSAHRTCSVRPQGGNTGFPAAFRGRLYKVLLQF